MSDAYKDNVVLDYAGIEESALTAKQKSQLLDLITVHVGNMRDADQTLIALRHLEEGKPTREHIHYANTKRK